VASSHAKEMMEATNRARELVTLLHKRFRTSWLLVALSFLAFSAAVAEQQTVWNNQNIPNDQCDGLKQLITLISTMSIFLVLRKHSLYNRQQKLMGTVPMDSNMWTGGNVRLLLFELVFNALHCPPYYTMEWKYKVGTNENIFAFYTLDALMTIFVTLRAYHLIELMYCRIHLSESKSKLSKRIGSTVTMGPMFVAKMILSKSPLFFVTSLSFFVCCMLAYCSWIFERGYCAPWAPQYDTEEEIIMRCSLTNIDRAANIGDSFWGMMNMMTTLGGTMPPLTVMGRVVSTLGVLVGLSLLALLLNATTKAMSFSDYEKSVHQNMEIQEHMQEKYAKAVHLMEATWLRYRAFNVEAPGGCCSRARARQAVAMDFFCRSLLEFRKCLTYDKQMAALGRSSKRAAGAGGGGDVEKLSHRIDSMEREMKARFEHLERVVLLAVGGFASERTAARVAGEAAGEAAAFAVKADNSIEDAKRVRETGVRIPEKLPLIYEAAHSEDPAIENSPLATSIVPLSSRVNPNYTPLTNGDSKMRSRMQERRRKGDEPATKDTDESFRGLVRALFAKHKPEKQHTVDAVLVKYKGRENELVGKLREKFKVGTDEMPDYPPPATRAENRKKKGGRHADSALEDMDNLAEVISKTEERNAKGKKEEKKEKPAGGDGEEETGSEKDKDPVSEAEEEEEVDEESEGGDKGGKDSNKRRRKDDKSEDESAEEDGSSDEDI
jgi:hypothetical protein